MSGTPSAFSNQFVTVMLLGVPLPTVVPVIVDGDATVFDSAVLSAGGPVPEWRGPTDDDELLRRALSARRGYRELYRLGGHARPRCRQQQREWRRDPHA